MERTEPSFIPGWLKGTGGGGGSGTHNNPDEGGFSRSKATHQLLQVNSNLESPRKSTSSSKSFSSTARRSHNTNGSVERQPSDRDHFGLARSKSGLNRNSSIRNSSKLNLEQNGYNSWIDGEYGHEVERDMYSRKKDWLAGMVLDGRDKDKEVDNPMRQLFSAGLAGKYSNLKRSQSISLSAQGKETGLTGAPANGNITGSSQKSVFEHNFPSLGNDDKQCSPRTSSIASPRPSIASPHVLWQGNPRSDLSRASSPGVTGGYGNPMSSVSASMSSGNDIWSSALADVPLPNGSIQCNNVSPSTLPSPSSSHMSSSVGPVTSAAPLNMAEALTQNPPHVRTPPQVLLESQRLEELALRQSRQLIPMTPSLPKAMSLVDKTKSKSSRTGDGSSTSSKIQSNTAQKSVMPTKPDNLKSSQGKLLVLKPGKDGNSVMTTTPKSDGNSVSQPNSQGNVTAPSASNITIAQRRQHVERRAATVADVLRTKDSVLQPDEKRTAVNAQNRSDFFNALRKKAATIGCNVSATVDSKEDTSVPTGIGLADEASPVDNEIEEKVNGVHHKLHLPSEECDGELVISSTIGPMKGDLLEDNSATLPDDESRNAPSRGDLDEEEAAFMRSLGWEEDEECSEITEEEIKDFYEKMENKKFPKSKLTGNFL